jgi:protoporphyrinogen/coproporphyrinogen III oxidase
MRYNLKESKPAIVIIGGGLTGLTLAFLLQRQNINFVLLEKSDRAGGVIQTLHREGFTYETGPNTGIIAHPEVAELFEMLAPGCELEPADPSAENRWILKNGQWYALPSGLIAGVRTPLFSLKDKLRILGEPFRKKGTDPLESVAHLVRRRMGTSFLDYAVDPFISGIYAGDPDRLVTQFALPKLYALEQNYGSFIGGAVKKAREPRSDRERKATRKVFSAKGGFSSLINAMAEAIPPDKIYFSAGESKVYKNENGFTTKFKTGKNEKHEISSSLVVSTIGAHAQAGLFDFIGPEAIKPVSELKYARVIQVIMAFQKWNGPVLNAFGGLIPTKENRKMLGVLFPSSIFANRAPAGGALLSVFLGGIKRPEIYDLDDEQLLGVVHSEMNDLLQTNLSEPAFIEIHRYQRAIPQYGEDSPDRLARIRELEKTHPGLILAGNIRNGIGIADRIKQATDISKLIIENS